MEAIVDNYGPYDVKENMWGPENCKASYKC